MNLQREKGEEQADQSDQNNSLSLKGGKKGKFSKSKKENIRGRQPDLEYEEERERERENEETTTKETLRFHRGEWLRSFEKRRLLDLSQFTGRIRFEGSPSKKVPKSPSLPLSLGKMMPRLPQQLTDEIKTKSALENHPSHTPPPLSYATNCVLMSPTPVYFYETAKPQVSRSSLQCLSWLHY